jgi:hypothetical protein
MVTMLSMQLSLGFCVNVRDYNNDKSLEEETAFPQRAPITPN